MLPRMMTRSAGRQTAAPRGGRTGGRTGRGGGRAREPTGRVGGRTGDSGGRGGDQGGGAYSQHLRCERENENQYRTWNGIGANQKLARLVPHLVTPENKRIERYIYGLTPHIRTMVAATEPLIIQSAVLKAGMLSDEAIRNGSLKKNTEKRGNGGELSRNENIRDDNKKSRTGKTFATITNHVRKEYTGTATKLTRAPRLGGNRQNQPMAIEGGQGHRNNGNQVHRGAFMMGAEEARQDPNIMIEPSDLGFRYEIEIASGKLVEINKVIRGCKLEIEVRIPLPHGEILRVLREKREEKVRCFMSAKTEEQKLKYIVIVKNFPEVFPDNLLGLPPSREFKFRIDLIPEAMSVEGVVKST
ncbi:hypothetical protein Tco_1556575 [Tanacetum coccineum]